MPVLGVFQYPLLLPSSGPETQALLKEDIRTNLTFSGVRRLYASLEHEDEQIFWLFVEADSLESQHALEQRLKTGHLGSTASRLFSPNNGNIIHLPLPQSTIIKELQAPSTEIFMVSFPSDFNAEQKRVVEKQVDQFVEQGLRPCSGFRNVWSAWALETDVPMTLETSGDKQHTGAMLMAFVAWDSLDAHVEHTKSQVFRESIHLLLDLGGKLAMRFVHVSCGTHELS